MPKSKRFMPTSKADRKCCGRLLKGHPGNGAPPALIDAFFKKRAKQLKRRAQLRQQKKGL